MLFNHLKGYRFFSLFKFFHANLNLKRTDPLKEKSIQQTSSWLYLDKQPSPLNSSRTSFNFLEESGMIKKTILNARLKTQFLFSNSLE